MLTGFLTTALEIVIVLDICGAVAYFVVAGILRSRDDDGKQVLFGGDASPLQPAYSTPYQASLAAPSLSEPAPVSLEPGPAPVCLKPGPRPVSGSDLSIYGGGVPQGQVGTDHGLMGGIRDRMASIRERIGNRSVFGKRQAEGPALNVEQSPVDRVLNSFREDAA